MEIENNFEKTLVAIGRIRMKFHSMIEELIDNGIEIENKKLLKSSIRISKVSSEWLKIEYRDDSPGWSYLQTPNILGVGCQLDNRNLHCHGFGLVALIASLQETYKVYDWVLKTQDVTIFGPLGNVTRVEKSDKNINGLYFQFKFPLKGISYLASHGNATTIEYYIKGLRSVLGSKYMIYLRSKILEIQISYPPNIEGNPNEIRNVNPCIPDFREFGSYDLVMADNKVHKISYGELERLLIDDDITDLYYGKSHDKGYFAIFKGKVLGLLRLEDIYNSSDYNKGKYYDYKNWYGVLELDMNTSGNVTNAIKDGLNENNGEVLQIIEAIKNHKVGPKQRNDLQVYANRRPNEGALKDRMDSFFRQTDERNGWIVKKEFIPYRDPYKGSPVRIDILKFHPILKIAEWRELKKKEFMPQDMRQLAGYKHFIESIVGRSDDENIHPDVQAMVDSDDHKWEHRFIATCKEGTLNEASELMMQVCPEEYGDFIMDDYEKYTNGV